MYNKIDRDVFRLCKSAENKSVHVSSRRYAWSPKLDQAIKLERLWEKIVKIGWDMTNSTILILSKEMGVEKDTKDKTEHKKILKQIKLDVHEVKNNSKQIRVQFLKDLASKYALDNNVPYEKAVRELLVHEELREIFTEIKFGLNLLQKSQTYRIWLPVSGRALDAPPENWKTTTTGQLEITNGDEIHGKILERNNIHLQQAKHTPFASSKLGKLLNYDGSGDLTDAFLTSTASEVGLEGICKKYLEGLKVKNMDTLEKVDSEINFDDYKSFWKKKGKAQQLHHSDYTLGITR